jgi:hypothetical protein
MFNLSKELEKISQENGISVEKIDVLVQKEIQESLLRKYTDETKYHFPLWDHLRDRSGFMSDEAWRWINEFTLSKPVILLFEFDLNESAYLITNSADLTTLIGEMPLFVFYLTDYTTSWMLCYSDHNSLHGVGKATDWVYSLYDKNNSMKK